MPEPTLNSQIAGLYHLDANGSDAGIYQRNLTLASGSIVTEGKFGGSLQSGNTAWAKGAYVSGVNLGANWTIEAWVKISAAAMDFYPFRARSPVEYNTSKYWYLNFESNRWYICGWNGSATKYYYATISTPINNWIHVALSCDNNTIRFFYNGVLSITIAFPYQESWGDGGINVCEVGTKAGYTGWVDDLCISTLCKYTTNFTPPTAPLALPQKSAGIWTRGGAVL